MKNLKLIIVLLLITLGIGYPSWGQEKGLPSSGDWGPYTVRGNESVALTANVNHKGTVTIPNGATLTITVADSYKAYNYIYFSDTHVVVGGRSCIFDVQQGGKLIIRGRKGGSNPVIVIIEGNFWDLYAESNFDEHGLLKTIDANDTDDQRRRYYKEPVIKCAGEIEFDYVKIQGNYLTVPGKGVVNFDGNSSGAVSSFTDCVFTNNCAQCGSAFSMDTNSDGTVNVTGCEFRKSECHGNPAPGGVIKGTGTARAKVNVENSEFHHNKSTGNAGAVYWSSFGDATAGIEFSGCSFHNNWSNLSGGAILFEGLCSFAGSEDNMNVFYDNVALRNGGAISIEGFGGSGAGSSSITYDINHVELYGNQSPCGAGLGIMLRASYFNNAPIAINLDNCNIHDNTSKFHSSGDDFKMSGAGIYINVSSSCTNPVDVALSNIIIHDNAAGYGAGVIMSNSGSNASITFGTNNKIYSNKANQSASLYTGENLPSYWNYGGGVFASNGNVIVKGGQIYDNVAAQNGGAMYMKGGIFNFYQGEIGISGHPNTAVNGAGVYMDGGTLNMTDTDGVNSYSGVQLCYNNASTNGGALYVNNGTVNMVSGLVSQNSATTSGGGIYQNNGTLTISGNSTIMNNNAGTSGGGVYVGSTIKLGAGNLTVMENHCGNHSVKNNIYLPSSKELTVISNDFNPQYVGIYAQNTADRFAVINCESPATTTTLQNIYNGLLNGTCNVFDDKQLYSADYNGSSDADNIYFINTPWTPLQRQTTAADNLKLIEGTDTYEVKDVKSLTAFLWYVNGITDIVTGAPFNEKHPSAKAKVTADIPMVGRYWVPIGTSTAAFTGTFDGGGHIISDLTMVAANASTEYGMFGNVAEGADIKNVVLRDCLFTGTNDYAGSMVYKMNGGTLSNCQAHGVVNTTYADCILGGLVGYAAGGEIHSCYSCVELGGYNMGGLVGKIASGGNLKNSFANAKFQYSGSDGTKYVGGLVGINVGTTANCYVREAAGSSYGSATYGTLVGQNEGTVSHCFCKEGSTPGNNVGANNNGTYSAVIDGDSYQYRVHDCNVSTTGKPLKYELNDWVKQNGATKYAKWNRPTTTAINGDYPLLKMAGSNAVTEDANGMLYYGNVNTLMSQFSDRAFWFYGSESNFNNYSGDKLYIDEDAALKQASSTKGTITATVGITLDNSAGINGAHPSQGGTDAIDWHFFSSSLSNAPVGINYTDNTPVSIYGTPNVYDFDGTGYFPATDADGNSYYSEWDFYSYYEPQYQWVNFKRNSASHYNMDTEEYFDYENETSLVPGKGYMVALADPEGTYLQCTGTLNNGNVAVSLSYAGQYRKGLNLLGNPYQSYLDFETFASNNSSIWPSVENATTPYYIIMDEDEKGYLAYTLEQSPNHMAAGRYIHPHQGFMVVAGKSTTATFTDGMRVTDLQGYDAHFRDQQVAYHPLVNLIATDANGNRDIATAELGRPDKGGAILADFATLANCLVYVHYDDKDYRIAFTQPGITSLPVRFVAFENGTYTLTWDTENGEFGYLHLIDNITGTDIDMLTAQEYTFTASTDDLRSRFKLVFAYTGIGEDEDTVTNANFAYMSKGQLTVEGEGTLQLIDMNGRVLHQTRLHGDVNTVELPQMAAGLYVLKLDGRTQKIVL